MILIKFRMRNANVLLFFMLLNAIAFCQQPENENATKEAKALLDYIYNLNGNLLSGQHSFNESPEYYYNRAHEISGKFPAVWGTDLYWNNKENPGPRIVEASIKKHNEGAIVTLMWHVGSPIDTAPYAWKENVQRSFSNEQWVALTTPGTDMHDKWLLQVDTIAKTLKKLQDAKIPVLWRPYHEMNGVWFWWGNKPGEEGFIKLWKMLYERLNNHHKINNLIWVWNANNPRDIPFDEAYAFDDFYPGDAYVDILATDIYHNDFEQKDYEALLKLADGKPIAIGEVGQLPKTNILEKQPKWAWFMVWSNWLETANTPKQVQDVYNYPRTLNRDEIEQKF